MEAVLAAGTIRNSAPTNWLGQSVAQLAAALVALERELDEPAQEARRTGYPTPRGASRRHSSR